MGILLTKQWVELGSKGRLVMEQLGVLEHDTCQNANLVA